MELLELAQNYFGDTRSGSLAGPFGGFLIAALTVVTVLLIRNMNARIRRLPERFPEQAPVEKPADKPEGVDGQRASGGAAGGGALREKGRSNTR